MNILVEVIPPKYRKYVLYVPFALVTLVLGAVDVANGADDPSWLDPATTTVLFVGTALGLTAASNTPDKKPEA